MPEFTGVPFTWTCPHLECSYQQTDSVHPELGPYYSLTCAKCGQACDESTLSHIDAEAWNTAMIQAMIQAAEKTI